MASEGRIKTVSTLDNSGLVWVGVGAVEEGVLSLLNIDYHYLIIFATIEVISCEEFNKSQHPKTTRIHVSRYPE